MSTNELEIASPAFRGVLIPLLQEYNNKILEIAARADEIREQAKSIRKNQSSLPTTYFDREIAYLSDRYHSELGRCNRLASSCQQMGRRVSQQLEHSRIDEFDRIELELRLAELESTLDWVRDELQAGLGFVTS